MGAAALAAIEDLSASRGGRWERKLKFGSRDCRRRLTDFGLRRSPTSTLVLTWIATGVERGVQLAQECIRIYLC